MKLKESIEGEERQVEAPRACVVAVQVRYSCCLVGDICIWKIWLHVASGAMSQVES